MTADSDFVMEFAALASQRLARADASLEDLEVDWRSRRSMAELARELHLLKGEAQLVGLKQVHSLAERTEVALCIAQVARASSDALVLVREGIELLQTAVGRLPGELGRSEVERFEAAVALLASHSPDRLRVVIAEDSSLALRMFKSILEAEGYEVYGARDGMEAKELVDRREPHVIITDIEMPRMDGFELIRVLRSNPVTQDLPVIVVTAHDSDSDWQQGVELGVAAYLIKANFKAELLTDVVSRALELR